MRLVDLSMTVEECDSTPFAKEEAYFKSRPIVRWELARRRREGLGELWPEFSNAPKSGSGSKDLADGVAAA